MSIGMVCLIITIVGLLVWVWRVTMSGDDE